VIAFFQLFAAHTKEALDSTVDSWISFMLEKLFHKLFFLHVGMQCMHSVILFWQFCLSVHPISELCLNACS